MRTVCFPMHEAFFEESLPLLPKDLGELLPRQLPDDAFHLQVQEGSQNFARIQPSGFDQVVNRSGLFRTQ
jgi:hypothetical protein